MLTTRETLPRLETLIALSLSAICAYNKALRLIELPEIRRCLVSFRENHECRISELSSTVHRLGGTPPDRKNLLRSLARVEADTETIEAALHRLKTSEENMSRSYVETLALELPGETKGIVRRNHDDKRYHLRFLEQALGTRFWEANGREANGREAA